MLKWVYDLVSNEAVRPIEETSVILYLVLKGKDTHV